MDHLLPNSIFQALLQERPLIFSSMVQLMLAGLGISKTIPSPVLLLAATNNLQARSYRPIMCYGLLAAPLACLIVPVGRLYRMLSLPLVRRGMSVQMQ